MRPWSKSRQRLQVMLALELLHSICTDVPPCVKPEPLGRDVAVLALYARPLAEWARPKGRLENGVWATFRRGFNHVFRSLQCPMPAPEEEQRTAFSAQLLLLEILWQDACSMCPLWTARPKVAADAWAEAKGGLRRAVDRLGVEDGDVPAMRAWDAYEKLMRMLR